VKLAGTGFNNADLGDIISGGSPNAGKPRTTGRKTIRVLDYSIRVQSSQLIELLQDLSSVEELATRLSIPMEAIVESEF
jgi:hypothetical protein